MPSGMMSPLDPSGYYADTEKEAAEMLLKYIAAEIKKANSEAEEYQAAFRAAKKQAWLLIRIMREIKQEGHGLPEGRENGG